MEKSVCLNSGQKAELRMAVPQQSDRRKIVHGYMEAVGAFIFQTRGPRNSKAALQSFSASYVLILPITEFRLFKLIIKSCSSATVWLRSNVVLL